MNLKTIQAVPATQFPKINDPIKKWAKENIQIGEQTHKKMFSISHYQRNVNQNHNEVTSHVGQNVCYPKVYIQAINSGEGVKKREPSYTVGGNAN